MQDCYGESTDQLSQSSCTKFPVDQIQYNLTFNTPCPFNESMCIAKTDNSAFTMDTHLFDSHQTLGINAPPSNRVFLRKLSTCSVIQSRQYSNTSIDLASLRMMEYLWLGSSSDSPYTYSLPVTASTDGLSYKVEYVLLPQIPKISVELHKIMHCC